MSIPKKNKITQITAIELLKRVVVESARNLGHNIKIRIKQIIALFLKLFYSLLKKYFFYFLTQTSQKFAPYIFVYSLGYVQILGNKKNEYLRQTTHFNARRHIVLLIIYKSINSLMLKYNLKPYVT